jgi:hypothetical protein
MLKVGMPRPLRDSRIPTPAGLFVARAVLVALAVLAVVGMNAGIIKAMGW